MLRIALSAGVSRHEVKIERPSLFPPVSVSRKLRRGGGCKMGSYQGGR